MGQAELNLQSRQGMGMNLRGFLLAAALSLWAMAACAADDVIVYKDAT